MKTIYRKILPCILAFEILIVSFFSCSIPVIAADFMPRDIVQAVEYGIETNDWEPFYRFLYNSADGLMYLVSQMGAVTTKDFQTWVDNNKKLESLVETVPAKKEGENIVFTKEFMSQLKAILDDYAKENEPYYIGKTYAFDTADFSLLTGNRNVYNTIKNLLNESTSGFIVCSFKSGDIWFADIDRNFSDLSFVKVRGNDRFIGIYDNETWKRLDWTVYRVRLGAEDEEIKTVAEFKEKAISTYSGNRYDYALTQESKILLPQDAELWKGGNCTLYLWPYLVSGETRRIRVFNDFADFQNYTLGKRSVYYTNNYYNYVPEDLTTSIDDLQQTVDDLSGVIDKLLGQITESTDESEIEDLLKQILDELKNNQGTGGGDGSGGGDVNVDIDLSSTNTLLSRILAKVTQIFDNLQSGGSEGTGGNILQESLDALFTKLDDLNTMLKKYLSEITGDLDDIKGQLANMSEQEFEQKSDSFLGEVMDAFSEISEVVKTKFPFSIPNDLRIFLSKIAPTQPEAEAALYLNDMSGIALYSGEHGGSGTTDGETNPPGGGGASRPGSSFVGVEHGGGGGSREPAEMREAPVFRLPIVIERYGIEEYIVIDMAPFDPLSRFSRSFFTIIFMVCLFNLTFKVIGMWGDIVG